MEAKIEARVRRTSPIRGKASAHIVFDEGSGMTNSNMEVWEEDGKLGISYGQNTDFVNLPPIRFGNFPMRKKCEWGAYCC